MARHGELKLNLGQQPSGTGTPFEIGISQLASPLVGMTVLAFSWPRGQRGSSESGSLGTPQVIR